MDELFREFLEDEGFGPAKQCKAVPKETITKFKGKLPDKLLEYWENFGWCSYAKGLFWTVDPDEWEPVLEAWIGDTEFMEKDAYYVIARSAFGEFFLWGKETGSSLRVVPTYSWIFPRFNAEQYKKYGLETMMQFFFALRTKNSLDFEDESDKPLFEKALQALGELDHDTMYGFVPALALGGSAEIKNLQKVSAVEHLVILAGLSERIVMQDVSKI